MTSHRVVGLSEVARLCDVSLSTVNRKVSKLRDYGAEKDDDGVWHVPVTAIEAVGWKLRPDTSPDMPVRSTVTGGDMPGDMSELHELRAEVIELRAKLIAAEANAEKWQMIAAERLQNLDDLRLSQRLLERRELSAEPLGEASVQQTPPVQVTQGREGFLGRWRRGPRT